MYFIRGLFFVIGKKVMMDGKIFDKIKHDNEKENINQINNK
jgi:hypothetical protein